MSSAPEWHRVLAALPDSQKRLLAVCLVGGSVAVGKKLQSAVKEAQCLQRRIVSDTAAQSGAAGARAQRRHNKVGVDKVFFKRLLTILKICIPGPLSREALLVLLQGCLLVSRTLLTDWISNVEGKSGRALVSQDFEGFLYSVAQFAAVGLPAAVVNSGLKYLTKTIELAFQHRLTTYLHGQYCSNRAYYAASTLGGLTHADQHITEDVEKFSYAISELYSRTVKPLLDVVLFTRSLSRVMGYKWQFALYGYYVAVAWLLRHISPPLAQMVAHEAGLSGAFRAAHQRLVSHSEEVAFNDPPSGGAEQLILNQHLRRLVGYTQLSAFQRFVQQIFDGYLVKYFASVTALLVYAAPIYLRDPSARGSQGELTQDYIRSMRLLQNTSRGVGDLILIYKRITALASHTSRVSELLEQVRVLSAEDAEHRELFRRNVSTTHIMGVSSSAPGGPAEPLLPPARLSGPNISFHRVALDAPDGTPLVRELSFEVAPGRSVMLMGANGSGKSSLFRVLAGLWPLQAGEVTTPSPHQLFYLSQRPYLVAGSLRDQLLYPHPPRAVWADASVEERIHFSGISGRAPPALGPELDAQLEGCLRAVELEYLLARGEGWDQVQNWSETLSGGEKQRLAMARLLHHRPRYAVLDECTSAVSPEGEMRLYEACQAAGITFLSIAHRPKLKAFHHTVVHFDGSVAATGKGFWIEDLTSLAEGEQDAAGAGQPGQQQGGSQTAGPSSPAPATADTTATATAAHRATGEEEFSGAVAAATGAEDSSSSPTQSAEAPGASSSSSSAGPSSQPPLPAPTAATATSATASPSKGAAASASRGKKGGQPTAANGTANRPPRS